MVAECLNVLFLGNWFVSRKTVKSDTLVNQSRFFGWARHFSLKHI